MAATDAARDRLRLTTASGNELVARLVLYGDRFGPNGRYVNAGRVLLEFRRADVSPSIAYVNSFHLGLFDTIKRDVRFSPDGTLPNALPLSELERLLEWLEAHRAAGQGYSPEDDELV